MSDDSPRPASHEPRDRAWLYDYVRQPIKPTPRNGRYVGVLNQQSTTFRKSLDLTWLCDGGEGYHARAQTNLLGLLAFLYRTPNTTLFRDRELLADLREGYLAVADHVTEEGKFIWPGELDMYWAGSHEHAWRLEPYLLGYIWSGDEFTPAERDRVEGAIRRASEWLWRNPLLQTNNRGAVWCAVATLGNLFYDSHECAELLATQPRRIIEEVVYADGEIGEHTEQYAGGGPDSNYTYTGWSYIYLYRLLSGNSELDERLLQGARWLSLYNSVSGCPLVDGASVRGRYANIHNSPDVLPMYERLSRQEPFFGRMASGMLARRENNLALPFDHQGGGHIVTPLIWAALEHGSAASDQPRPEWHRRHFAFYRRPQTHYALIARSYQTGIVSRGLHNKWTSFPLRGLQSFSLDGELPILLNGDAVNSSTVADGIDSATTNVDCGQHGWEIIHEQCPGKDGRELDTVIERRAHLWALYAFTPESMIVVYGGARGEIVSRWAMNHQAVPPPQLDAVRQRVTFAERKGTIVYAGGAATVHPYRPGGGETDPDAAVLEITAPPPYAAFGFGGPALRFDAVNAQQICFSDSSGRYTVDVEAMLDERGDLMRGRQRLQRRQ